MMPLTNVVGSSWEKKESGLALVLNYRKRVSDCLLAIKISRF
jgi:hypothetical protein